MGNVSTAEMTVGIDLGDRQSRVCVLGAAGEIVEEGRIATTEAALLPRLRGMAKARVVMEVGTHSPWVSRLAKAAGHEVIVANPREVRLISHSTRKTDRNDALTLARLGRVDPQLLKPVAHRSKEAQADLAVLRSRHALVASRTMLINQVRGTVKAVGGRLPACDAHYFHRKAVVHVPAEVRDAVLPLIETIAELSRQIGEIDARLEEMIAARYPQAKLLQQVPGVGTIISLTFVLTIDDPKRFQRSRQVGAYLGLVPRQQQSGERTPQLGITKAGDVSLRTLLIQGAHHILGWRGPDSDLRRWGLARMERGGANAKKRALVAVARKLAVLLHHLWTTGEVYRPLREAPVM